MESTSNYKLVADSNIASRQVIGMATNTSMVLNCALVTYIIMTADARLPDANNE